MQIYARAKSIYANQVYRDASFASIWSQGTAAHADVSHLDRLAQLPIQTPWKVWSPKTPATSPSTIGKTYYVDGKTGSDSNSGLSLSKAFATTQHAADVVQAGDTVLIAAGIYHSTIRMINGASGEPGKPITFGSYGNGPVIIDGSPIVTGWRQISGSVWEARINFKPIAVVINAVPLKPSLDGAIGVTPNSGLWYATPSSLRVDFGRTTPAKADIVIPSTQNETVVYFYNKDYLIFNGLTVRGSGAGGI
ncbi:hypothetical protein THIX_10313 [Thiomonas sp. X19]|nr:hypothetical protein THIX_10313 [Thiomonas sp. X19]